MKIRPKPHASLRESLTSTAQHGTAAADGLFLERSDLVPLRGRGVFESLQVRQIVIFFVTRRFPKFEFFTFHRKATVQGCVYTTGSVMVAS